ncbi:MAG: hypothetical protein Q8S19_06410, partial [Bacillota bacterium]|nr:hypothetical protein [Bacillota bacterium]
MRKIRTISFVLVFCMILVVSASANLNDSIVTYYSREQFVLRLAAMESIDMQAAEARVFELENSTGQNGQYTYCEFTSFYDYCNGHVVEAGVLFLMGNGSAHRSSCGVASKWTKAATTGNYTWTEAYHVVEFTPTQIVQMVRGRVAISLNINSPRV